MRDFTKSNWTFFGFFLAATSISASAASHCFCLIKLLIFNGNALCEDCGISAFFNTMNGVAKEGVIGVDCMPVLLAVIEVDKPVGE